MPRDMFGDVVDPSIKLGSQKWYTVPLSIVAHVAIFGAVIGAFGHYMHHGRKGVQGVADHDANLPDEIRRKGEQE